MDQSNRKRKGLGAKGKLAMMSFYRASTSKQPLASAIHHHHYTTAAGSNINNKVKQDRVLMNNPTPTRQRAAACSSVEFIVNQEKVSPQPKQNVSILLQDSSSRATVVDSLYGGIAVDESVDSKASTYISCVRERIGLQVQTINS